MIIKKMKKVKNVVHFVTKKEIMTVLEDFYPNMKTRLLIISSLIIISMVIVILGIVISGIPRDKTIDSSSLEYLKSLQKICKQNEDGGFVSMIDGPRWQNATHYFDVPDCQFRKLISSDHTGE